MQMTIRFIPALMTLTDVKSSEEAAKELCKWFHDNLMKVILANVIYLLEQMTMLQSG